MQITPDALEHESLSTAANRLDFLSRRDTGGAELNTVVAVDEDDWSPIAGGGTSLDVEESLELLALGEVVSRKAHGSRLAGMRAALRGGAGWDEIGAALGVSPAQAWDTFQELLAGEDGDVVASARALAGSRPA
ncbi:MAG TPA: hypothetical protein VGA45_08455 [Actinomycetota bacterium]